MSLSQRGVFGRSAEGALHRISIMGLGALLSSCALIYDFSDYRAAGAGGSAGAPSGSSSGSGTSSSTGSGPGVLPAALWSDKFGSTGDDRVLKMAVDTAGNVYVLGAFGGPVTIDQAYKLLDTEVGLILIKIDPGGAVIWSKLLAASSISTGITADLAVTKDDGVAITAGFDRWSDLTSSGMQTPAGGSFDVLIEALSKEGTFVWGKTYGGSGFQQGTGIAVGPSGEVAIAGALATEMLNFGNSNCVADPTMTSGVGLFVVMFNGVGSCLSAKTFPGTVDAHGDKIVIDNAGAITVSGSLNGEILVGGPVDRLTSQSATGTRDGFVLRLSASGDPQFGLLLAPEARVQLTADAQNTIFLAGTASDKPWYEMNTTQDHHGGLDMLVASITSNNILAWSRLFGGAGDDTAALTLDPSGGIVIAGSFDDKIRLGDVDLTSADGLDAFIGTLNANGDPGPGPATFGGAGDQVIDFIRVKDGNRIVAGHFRDSLDVGGGAATGTGGDDVFVAKFPATP